MLSLPRCPSPCPISLLGDKSHAKKYYHWNSGAGIGGQRGFEWGPCCQSRPTGKTVEARQSPASRGKPPEGAPRKICAEVCPGSAEIHQGATRRCRTIVSGCQSEMGNA